MKKAILLTNLGSPDSTEVKDVRKYLNEFLMDERVIDIPYLVRLLLVKGIIVPLRAPKSAAKYKTIWTKDGSPLVHTTSLLTELVAAETNLPTYFCMRYANPTPDVVLTKLTTENLDLEELIVIPLYPHYAMSSYETAVEHIKISYQKGGFTFKLSVVPPFYQDEKYIEALAASIQPFLENQYDHVLFSYHGIPERHVKKTDITKSHCLMVNDCCNKSSEAHKYCYRHQVKVTTEKAAEALKLPKEKYSFSFQSRLGADAWLKPFTVEELQRMPKAGIKKLLVLSPAFVSDCLETLEEIHVEGKEDFLKAGGEVFDVVPCLNTNEQWVKTIHHLIEQTQ